MTLGKDLDKRLVHKGEITDIERKLWGVSPLETRDFFDRVARLSGIGVEEYIQQSTFERADYVYRNPDIEMNPEEKGHYYIRTHMDNAYNEINRGVHNFLDRIREFGDLPKVIKFMGEHLTSLKRKSPEEFENIAPRGILDGELVELVDPSDKARQLVEGLFFRGGAFGEQYNRSLTTAIYRFQNNFVKTKGYESILKPSYCYTGPGVFYDNNRGFFLIDPSITRLITRAEDKEVITEFLEGFENFAKNLHKSTD